MLQETLNVTMAMAVDAELAVRAWGGTKRLVASETPETPKGSRFAPVIARIRSHAAMSMAQVRPVVYV